MELKSTGKGKRAAASAAAELVDDGMTIGIGSGSTVLCLIEAIAGRNLSVTAVTASNSSAKRAESEGIRVVDPDQVHRLDIAIDGADEVDPQKQLIKGGGAALLREKLVASMADEFIVIVGEEKQVDQLGTFGLPVEILPFAHQHTLRHLQELSFEVKLREGVLTDNGNLIADIAFPNLIENAEELDQLLHSIPGVLETGLFLGMAGRVMVGFDDGRVEIR